MEIMNYELYNYKNAELIIYTLSKLKDKPKYGVTILGKTLSLIDFMSYLKTGKAISDFDYIKQDYGPTSESAKFLRTMDSLVANDELKRIEVPYFNTNQIKYLANRKPDIDVFTKEEIVIINNVIDSISDMSATEISDYTHTFISWIFANNKEIIPFYTFLLTNQEPDQADIDWARKLVKKHENLAI